MPGRWRPARGPAARAGSRAACEISHGAGCSRSTVEHGTSTCPVLAVTGPGTAIVPFGTNLNGSNVPARPVSYSSGRRSNFSPSNSRPAIAPYPARHHPRRGRAGEGAGRPTVSRRRTTRGFHPRAGGEQCRPRAGGHHPGAGGCRGRGLSVDSLVPRRNAFDPGRSRPAVKFVVDAMRRTGRSGHAAVPDRRQNQRPPPEPRRNTLLRRR